MPKGRGARLEDEGVGTPGCPPAATGWSREPPPQWAPSPPCSLHRLRQRCWSRYRPPAPCASWAASPEASPRASPAAQHSCVGRGQNRSRPRRLRSRTLLRIFVACKCSPSLPPTTLTVSEMCNCRLMDRLRTTDLSQPSNRVDSQPKCSWARWHEVAIVAALYDDDDRASPSALLLGAREAFRLGLGLLPRSGRHPGPILLDAAGRCASALPALRYRAEYM